MNTSMSVTTKLAILIVLAVVFAAALVTLSVRRVRADGEKNEFWSEDRKNYSNQFTVEPNGTLVISADEGDVTITGTDSNQVSVEVSMDGDASRVDRYKVNMSQDGNTVRIEGKNDRKFFRWFNERSLSVHFNVRVPSKFNLDLTTAGGDLVITGVTGRATGETSGGNLELTDFTGPVKLETSGGDVRINHIDGDLYFRTSGGNIRAEKILGALDVETSGGDIRCRDIDAKLHASTSGGNIDVQLLANKGVNLGTSGGNVRIDLPKGVKADVDAETTGGDVNCEMEFNGKIKDGRMDGRINGGGELISAHTSGGDITITAAGSGS